VLARDGRRGLGLAIKVEDAPAGAKQAVALHLLKQLDWLTRSPLEENSASSSYSPGLGLEAGGVQGSCA